MIREMRLRGRARPLELRIIESIGNSLRAHRVSRVDFYSCEMGQGGSDGLFLDNLHNLWGVPLRGMKGTVVLHDRGEGQQRYGLKVKARGRTSPMYRDQIPSDEWWYSSTGVYERPVPIPSGVRSLEL